MLMECNPNNIISHECHIQIALLISAKIKFIFGVYFYFLTTIMMKISVLISVFNWFWILWTAKHVRSNPYFKCDQNVNTNLIFRFHIFTHCFTFVMLLHIPVRAIQWKYSFHIWHEMSKTENSRNNYCKDDVTPCSNQNPRETVYQIK